MNVLAREGEYWTVVFGDRVSRVRDAKGLHYLDHLLRHPNEEFHALALVAAAGDGVVGDRSDAGPVLDAAAVSSYRRRYLELQEEVADAEAAGDVGMLARAQDELDALTEQLAGGLGLGGRHRRAGSPAERARLAVTKAIRSAQARLEQADPDLGGHLRRMVRTGTFCSYTGELVWGHAPVPDPQSPAPPPARRRRPVRTQFVGRPLERGLMQELVAAAAGGRGGLLLLRGEAGIGKTRLAEEAAVHAEERDMGVFVGRCLDVQPALAWLPLIEVLDQVVAWLQDGDLRELLGATGPEVAKVLPGLRRRIPDLPAPLELPAEHGRLHLYAALRDLLLRLGARRPAVVVVEDLHWADPATLRMVEHLTDGLEEARILVIGTYRSDEAVLGTALAQTLERLARHPSVTTVAVGRMETAEVAELVASLTGRLPDPLVAAALSAEADGNPLFVEELVKHLASEGQLFADDGGFHTDLRLDAGTVPAGLRLLLGHRLQRLSPASREVVGLAAVAGRDLDLEMLAGADDSAIDEALAAGVLVVAAGDRFAFGHALVRQAALSELSPVRRRRLHQQVATALAARHGNHPEHAGEIADHLLAAGSGAEALPYLETAGRRSLESAAYEDAAARFRRALELAPGGDRPMRARLLSGLGYAQRGLGAPGDANVTWLEALELLEGATGGDRALATELSRALGRYLDATGGLDRAVALLNRALRFAGEAPTAERSWLTSALGYALTLTGDIAGASACLDEAATIAETLDDDRLRADVLASRTSLEFATGRLRDCVATAEAASQALLDCGLVWDAVQAQVTTTWPRLWLGRPGDSRRQVEETLPLAERVGHQAAVFLARRSVGLLDLVSAGDLKRFAAQAADGLAHCQAHRLRWLPDAHVLVGLAAFWAGDWDTAASQLEAGSTAPAPPVYAGRYTATRLLFLAWRGDHDAFDRLLAELHRTFDDMGRPQTLGTMAVTLAEVEGQALLGRRRAAADLYPAVAAVLDAGVILRPPDIRIVDALVGLAAGLAGDQAVATRHFDNARRLATSLPHRRQHPDLDLLEALAAEPLRARPLLDRAAAGYGALGMPRHQALAQSLARGVRPIPRSSPFG